MNIEVVGRHALLFDDDASACFVNSDSALVEWNSLLIDRYDVRHLLSGPPPSRRRRNQPHSMFSTASAESELDNERYLDLPPPSEEQESDEAANQANTGEYNAVAFSYGNTDDFNHQKNAESELESPTFHPPFPVPESLLQNLPQTEKMHQIIARTAMFVSKHGGQSEIVLRVKQGKNPAFGFLMPDDHLHGYFRFLVDHQELLRSDGDEKPQREEKISDGDGGGALSLLGSLYGYGEDEDAEIENASESKKEYPASTGIKDEAVSKHILPCKEKSTTSRKSSKSASSSRTKKDEEKLQASSLPLIPKIEPLMVEPPSDLKRLVDKIVEFIIKNGKQFEAVLVEQDIGHARFPFLLPTNQYHPYYLKVLEKAQQSKLTGKSTYPSEKHKRGVEKKSSVSKESDTHSQGSAGCDIPYDSKEKFKMVLPNKSKKDVGPDQSSRTTTHQQEFGVCVDAAAAAAILQAATRGIKNPNFGFLYSNSLNGNKQNQDHSGEGIQKSDQNVASEADSSEAHLTREQKLKAERLKRAKMFVAMLKTGAGPQESGVVNVVGKEREGSSAPLDFDDKNEKMHSGDDECERRSKRSYRSRSSRHDDDDGDDDDDDKMERKHSKRKHRSHLSSSHGEIDHVDDKFLRKKQRSHMSSHEDIDEEDERDEKYYSGKKRHRSHRSSHAEIKEEEDSEKKDDKYSSKKHRSRHSSREEIDKHSRKKHHDEETDQEENERDKKKKHRSRKSSRHHKDGRRERESRKKRDVSSDNDDDEVEDGEISSKISAREEASVDFSSLNHQDWTTTNMAAEPAEVTVVPDDLRAKIRAMLRATM